MIKAIKHRPQATMPTKGSEGAAGFDLYAASFLDLGPALYGKVETGIGLEIPPGYYGQIAPRSGLAARHGIDTLAGVIDSDYRGEVVVIMVNHGWDVFSVKPGDRIAQIIFMPIAECAEIEEVDGLSDSQRGFDGFGSTGI